MQRVWLKIASSTLLSANYIIIIIIIFFFFFHQIENSIKYLRTFPTIPHLTPGGNVGGMFDFGGKGACLLREKFKT